MPRRASRSQRNNSPRCYLNPRSQEPPSVPPNNIENTAQEAHTHLSLESVAHNIDRGSTKVPLSFKSAAPLYSINQCLTMEANPASNKCTVYPLYFGNGLHTQGYDFHSGESVKFDSKLVEPAEVGALQNLLYCHKNASDKSSQADLRDISKSSIEDDCDLSLRLGPLSIPCGVESRWPQEVEDFGLSSFQEGSKFGD